MEHEPTTYKDGDDSDDSDDEIKLDGAMTRRSDAEEDDEEDEEEEEEEEEGEGADRIGAGAAPPGDDEQTVVDVCLDFCDPHERFFHGIRCGVQLLTRVLRRVFPAPSRSVGLRGLVSQREPSLLRLCHLLVRVIHVY